MPSELSIRDRLATLSRRELAGLVVLVLGLVAAAGVWYVRSLPSPVAVQQVTEVDPGGGGVPLAGPTASATSGSIFVHVAGLVRRPGVYEFAQGDRVIDAIEAARGARPGAELDGLNLAAQLADGTQIVVPARGGSTADLPGAVADPAGELIDINVADAAELEELSGIGEVLAQAIVDYRTENGPFSSIEELEDVSGIGPATLEEIRDHVTI
jgi:competence protein ComEA